MSKTFSTIIANSAKHRMKEGLLILSVCLSVFLLLALVTYHHTDPSWSTAGSNTVVANAGGIVGAWIADFLLYGVGYVAYLFPFILAGLAWVTFRNEIESSRYHVLWRVIRVTGFVIFLISTTTLLDMYIAAQAGIPLIAGGVLGDILRPLFVNLLNPIGATLVLVALVLIGFTLMFGISWFNVLGLMIKHLAVRFYHTWMHWQEAREARATAKAFEPVVQEEPVKLVVPSPSAEEESFELEEVPVVKQKNIRPKKIAPAPMLATAPTAYRDKENGIPSINLLDSTPKQHQLGFNKTELDELSRLVEMRLSEFGIQVKVMGTYPGPVVTRFELALAPGMKASKITALGKDLARSLSFPSVRVVEVIPGKSYVGLEIPNQHRETVRLKEILQSSLYQNAESTLSLALGKDIAGNPVVIDVAKLPHLLVAGTTGAGKSVSLNAMILSLLLKATPQEVRLIMIDPKMLELSIYEGIPHLLTSVVTHMKEAANALRWCVGEMERRYRLMASMSVRNLAGFNSKVRAAINAGSPLRDPFFVETDNYSGEAPVLEPLPKIVVIIDELADMMMVVGKKVEELIARIAQKARAAGIHMILATQRPSVDVITGLIKANIPGRIAFNVSSRIDSRTILDQQGAENLLGSGDMLYLPPGTGLPLRVHGAFVADEEVIRVVDAWKKCAEPHYLEEIVSGDSEPSGVSGFFEEEDDSEADPLYDEAVAIVLESRRASISSIQRRLKIGYNRAARMMEVMESAGIVSAMETNGSREVLAPPPPKD